MNLHEACENIYETYIKPVNTFVELIENILKPIQISQRPREM